jgi:DNA topoisomerase-2
MNWSVGIAPSDDGYQQISFVNTTDTYDGGTHVDYILNQVIVELRDFFQKKHKVDIKPSELKSHIFFFLNATVVNPSFSSQTKEKLITEIKDFGTTYQISDKLVKWVLKSEIVNSILDWIQKKKSADDSKLARELNKNISKLKVDKLIDAKGKDRWKCSLAIFEGDSAISGFRKYRNSQLQGGFTLRGKFMNVNDITTKKLSENSEAVGLMSAIGLRIGKKAEIKDLRYGRILIYTDADCLDPETIIITKGGEKKISDITYDDLILTHTGSYKKVKNIIQKDVSRYMKIIINGNTIICSENHKFMIFRDGEVMEVEAKNIKYSDHFLIKR